MATNGFSLASLKEFPRSRFVLLKNVNHVGLVSLLQIMLERDADRNAPFERGGGVILASRHRGKVTTPETTITGI